MAHNSCDSVTPSHPWPRLSKGMAPWLAHPLTAWERVMEALHSKGGERPPRRGGLVIAPACVSVPKGTTVSIAGTVRGRLSRVPAPNGSTFYFPLAGSSVRQDNVAVVSQGALPYSMGVHAAPYPPHRCLARPARAVSPTRLPVFMPMKMS